MAAVSHAAGAKTVVVAVTPGALLTPWAKDPGGAAAVLIPFMPGQVWSENQTWVSTCCDCPLTLSLFGSGTFHAELRHCNRLDHFRRRLACGEATGHIPRGRAPAAVPGRSLPGPHERHDTDPCLLQL